MDLKNSVLRRIACVSVAHAQCELVQWAGVALMLHRREDHAGHIKMADQYACSHEPTGYLIGKGPSPETALAMAIEKIRRNWDLFHEQIAALPVINPPAA